MRFSFAADTNKKRKLTLTGFHANHDANRDTIVEQMPFFLLLPVWLLCVLVGLVLVFVRSLRSIGVYTLTMSTVALLCSFGLSTAVLYFGPRLFSNTHPSWFGVALIAAYFCAIGVGGIGGAIAGFLATHRVLRHR